MKMTNTIIIENEATTKHSFESKLFPLNNGEFGMNYSFELRSAFECFYGVMKYGMGIPVKPFIVQLNEITNSPELIERAHKIIASLKAEILQVRSLLEGEAIQK